MLVTATAAQRVIDEIDKEIVQPLHDLIGLPLETVMVEKNKEYGVIIFKLNLFKLSVRKDFLKFVRYFHKYSLTEIHLSTQL